LTADGATADTRNPTARRRIAIAAGLVVAAIGLASLVSILRYPSDTTPDGAYLRIAKAVNLGRPRDFFAYIETEAQHAAYTIRDYRKKARDRVLATYPEPERSELAKRYEPFATAPDGADVFALYSDERGFLGLLRRDMSGIAKVDISGERATIETARGTRYAFRRRENGIWGLTLFTAVLVSEAEKAARDLSVIEKAASDYERSGDRAGGDRR
jgi:hypothetical protein